ncbi:hypothetical protein [Aurantimonas sp. VKM B-3413]|uniref:hypothetical protein n=1 Tax=Aurantimonas sp. VKM B-3413 TaxID=2779401 RepID=UPI001E367E58|nr:hypothetical protein [Aurantimonas sp. VKM B-3413]MCB8836606.1 hypothetical protein [Aurantimonas sp. VKM B-3413]
MRFLPTALLAALVAAGTLARPAAAADLGTYSAPPVEAHVPACDDAGVLGEVEDQFEYGAPRVLERQLEILEFSGMHERAFIPQYAPAEDDIPPAQPIERRWCEAQALISDGKRRTVYYIIEYPMGFAAAGQYLGIFSPAPGWRAEGCVLGLDEWHVYGANCQSLRRYPPEGRSYQTYQGFVSKG